MKKIVLILISTFVLWRLIGIKVTKSFFTDTEKVRGNILSVATSWASVTPAPSIAPTFIPSPLPEPILTVSPTPSPFSLADHLVINEVYYDVAPNKGDESKNEWVEIYNPTGNTVDISGWKICDNTDCETIPSSSLVPVGGYVVITPQESTWSYWTIPDSVGKIVLGTSNIGSGLHNDNDRVILKTPQGIEIDKMSWGTDTYAFNPPCGDVVEGHSLERSPAGKDTDTAADFFDRSVPTPGY